jgi:hypothetical protein
MHHCHTWPTIKTDSRFGISVKIWVGKASRRSISTSHSHTPSRLWECLLDSFLNTSICQRAWQIETHNDVLALYRWYECVIIIRYQIFSDRPLLEIFLECHVTSKTAIISKEYWWNVTFTHLQVFYGEKKRPWYQVIMIWSNDYWVSVNLNISDTRKAINRESVKYLSRFPTPCSWRLDTIRQYGKNGDRTLVCQVSIIDCWIFSVLGRTLVSSKLTKNWRDVSRAIFNSEWTK